MCEERWHLSNPIGGRIVLVHIVFSIHFAPGQPVSTHLAVLLMLGKFRLLATIPLDDSGHCEPEDIEDVDLPHLQPCSHFPLKVTICSSQLKLIYPW